MCQHYSGKSSCNDLLILGNFCWSIYWKKINNFTAFCLFFHEIPTDQFTEENSLLICANNSLMKQVYLLYLPILNYICHDFFPFLISSFTWKICITQLETRLQSSVNIPFWPLLNTSKILSGWCAFWLQCIPINSGVLYSQIIYWYIEESNEP